MVRDCRTRSSAAQLPPFLRDPAELVVRDGDGVSAGGRSAGCAGSMARSVCVGVLREPPGLPAVAVPGSLGADEGTATARRLGARVGGAVPSGASTARRPGRPGPRLLRQTPGAPVVVQRLEYLPGASFPPCAGRGRGRARRPSSAADSRSWANANARPRRRSARPATRRRRRTPMSSAHGGRALVVVAARARGCASARPGRRAGPGAGGTCPPRAGSAGPGLPPRCSSSAHSWCFGRGTRGGLGAPENAAAGRRASATPWKRLRPVSACWSSSLRWRKE